MLPQDTPKPLAALQPFGEMLIAGAMADVSPAALPGTAACAHASTVLASLVRGNATAQLRAAGTNVSVRPGRLSAAKEHSLPSFIMLQLSRAWAAAGNGDVTASGSALTGASVPQEPCTPARVRSGAAGWAVPALLCLAVTLADGQPTVAASMLHDASHVPLLLEMMQHTQTVDAGLIGGLTALLCGCCVLGSGDAGSSQGHVLTVLSHRLGLRGFFALLDGLLDADEMQVRRLDDCGTSLWHCALSDTPVDTVVGC